MKIILKKNKSEKLQKIIQKTKKKNNAVDILTCVIFWVKMITFYFHVLPFEYKQIASFYRYLPEKKIVLSKLVWIPAKYEHVQTFFFNSSTYLSLFASLYLC